MLAIAVGQLASTLDVPPSSRASPLPHWIFSGQKTCVRHSSLCGSKACSRKRWVSWPGCWLCRPLREQARSHTGSSVGKKFMFGTVPSVGASLLAIAVGQLAWMLAVPTSSRASPLPHWIFSGQKTCVRHRSLCGSKACSRKRWVSLPGCWLCRPLREQARSHTGSSVGKKFMFGTVPSVGASLLAIAVGQLAWMLAVPTSSRASPLPHWIFSGQKTCVRHRSLCGSKACSRKRWVSWPGCWLCRPLREQARSHTGSSVGKKLVFDAVPSVGAKLARDSGGSACINVGCAAVFASKLAPTLDLHWARNLCLAQIPCGSELARESGGSACLDVGCAGLFASKLAPTLDLQWARNLCSAQIPLWEQSLLAMAGGGECTGAIAGKPCSHMDSWR